MTSVSRRSCTSRDGRLPSLEINIPKLKVWTTKIQQSKSRHPIYLVKDLVSDSAFPFKPIQCMIVRIDCNRLLIERAKK